MGKLKNENIDKELVKAKDLLAVAEKGVNEIKDISSSEKRIFLSVRGNKEASYIAVWHCKLKN